MNLRRHHILFAVCVAIFLGMTGLLLFGKEAQAPSSKLPEASLQAAKNDSLETVPTAASETPTASATPLAYEGAATDDVRTKKTTQYAWQSYKKPSEVKIQLMLSPLAFEVTQRNGTEIPFSSPLAEQFDAGIYVDVLSGEPLFSSKDKYDSGTGWPSFVKPITPDSVIYDSDSSFSMVRTEVRSRYANDHLGHVFDDGPVDRGGKRYCMNGVALRFVPLSQMEKDGYGDFVHLVATN